MRAGPGTGQLVGSTGDSVLDAVLAAFARRAGVDLDDVATTDATGVAEFLAQLARQARLKAGDATAGEGAALVVVAVEKAATGGLMGDMPAGQRQLLLRLAQKARLRVHVRVLSPGAGSEALVAAAKALGQCLAVEEWPDAVEAAPAPKGLLAARREILSGVEERELPEVRAAKERHDETHAKGRGIRQP